MGLLFLGEGKRAPKSRSISVLEADSQCSLPDIILKWFLTAVELKKNQFNSKLGRNFRFNWRKLDFKIATFEFKIKQ